MVEIYRSGFIGATTPEASEWIAAQVGDAKNICVPFTGTARDVASMCGEGRTIESWDTQFYSRAIVEGVLGAKVGETNVDAVHYRQGWMYTTRTLKNIDERSAGFIDWVADNGTLLDKASLGSAIVRCTLMGRMTQWYANIEMLWTRFQKARAYNIAWINRPGTFIHHEGSIFDELPVKSYDFMQVDPPKIVVGGDVYSANFDVLNKALKGEVVDLPRWTSRDSIPYFRKIMSIDAERILFMYVSKVKPPIEEIERLLLEYGELVEKKEFTHRGRTDYALLLNRK